MMRSKVIMKRPYGTRISMDYLGYLLFINKTYCKVPYPAVRITYAELIDGLVRCKECEIIVNLIMYLLFKCAYPKDLEYGKFTIHYSMETTSGIITYAIGQAITFRVGGVNHPVRDIVDEYVRVKAEAYGDAIARLIAESVISDEVYDRIVVRKIENCKPKDLKNITRVKPNRKERRSFIVADTQTILVEFDTDQIEKVYMPYAVGFFSGKIWFCHV
ncbi:hypothetical protein KY284_010806 [Solanum tuberosum]|nr:hypothetical protein KY284_010806 [Solanum tuberosum]